MITPDKAQALLKGTMPTPWKIDTEEHTYSTAFTDETNVEIFLDNGEDPICSETVLPDEVPQYQATFELMAAAPDMAKQIAGMRYEYAVQAHIDGRWVFYKRTTPTCTITTREPYNAKWFDTLTAAQRKATTTHYPTRIMTRTVTNPEVTA